MSAIKRGRACVRLMARYPLHSTTRRSTVDGDGSRVNARKIIIYTTAWCSYCQRAKSLLDSKGVSYEERLVDDEPGLRAEVARRSGRRTMPQAFVDGEPLGGYDDLAALERDGRLDGILGIG